MFYGRFATGRSLALLVSCYEGGQYGVSAWGDIPLLRLGIRIKPCREFALELPGKGNDLCQGAVQLLRDAVAQFHARQ